jgi:hypothetical protein
LCNFKSLGLARRSTISHLKKKKVWTYPSTQLPPIILLDHLHQSCLQLLSSNKELKLTELNAILLENNLTTYTVTLHQILQTTTEKKKFSKDCHWENNFVITVVSKRDCHLKTKM